MGRVLLFSTPKVDPIAPDYRFLDGEGTEALRWVRALAAELDTRALSKIAVISFVFGMPELAKLNADDASEKLVELTQRPDVCAVLKAYESGKPPTRLGAL
jgi:hypothetical protein